MNIISIILYERLHRYVYDDYFNPKRKSIKDNKIDWYETYAACEIHFRGWRIVLAIWLPFIKRYKRYAYYKAILYDYELNQVNKFSRLIYRWKNKLKISATKLGL